MKKFVAFAVAAGLSGLAAPALAQADNRDFDGPYVSVAVGKTLQRADGGARILFDRNLDGVFGDTVTTTTGADAFSPGFCGGFARGNSAAGGCGPDDSGVDISARIGYDWQRGNWVFGGLVEFGKADVTDHVTGFTITPASYVMTRELKYNGRVAARGGYVADRTLFYATGGLSFGRVENSFTTSNTVNIFPDNGNSNAIGFNLGAGIERKIGSNVALGVEFLHTDLKDDDYRVRASRGTATPPTNPFILGNASGTDFARSDDRFRHQSIRATLSYRF
jgi:outer membrane immunogenic protein